jgi:His/Glu/Gln/Arg/opine family amino acid ABC transporter permease subunit
MQRIDHATIGLAPRSHTEARPAKNILLLILDKAFYAFFVLALFAFAYYFYVYRHRFLLDLPLLLQGAGTTIWLSVSSMILATLFGFVGAMGRLSPLAPIRWLALLYVEIVRGTPILVQLLLWGFGVSGLLSNLGFDPYTAAYQFMTTIQENSFMPGPASQLFFDAAFYGILGLSFNYGAYLTEVFRTGIESVDRGQSEAALSLGLNSRQVLFRIVLPQAIRMTIPPFANYFITLVQDTSLLSLLGGVIEIQQLTTSLASPLSSDPNAMLFVYIFGASLFFIICYPLALLARFLEGRLAIAY